MSVQLVISIKSMSLSAELRQHSCYVPFNIDTSDKEDKEDVQPLYELPDGQVIKVWQTTSFTCFFS
jgi:hypothetical protein